MEMPQEMGIIFGHVYAGTHKCKHEPRAKRQLPPFTSFHSCFVVKAIRKSIINIQVIYLRCKFEVFLVYHTSSSILLEKLK